MTGLQKAAVLMVAVGSGEGAAILQHIPEDEATALARAIAQLERISADDVTNVLEEFSQQASSQQFFLTGGMDYAEEMLTEAYGPSVAQGLLQRLRKVFGKGTFNFDNLLKTEPQQLAKLIQDEHPQTIALVLAHLDSPQAATLLSCLPAELRIDVTTRIADLDQISPEIVRQIATVIDQKLRNLGELSREACGGVRSVANIVNRLDPSTCSQLMNAMEEKTPVLFENVRRFMFVFRDFETLDAKTLALLFERVPRAQMVVALKGANEPLRQKFLAAQSQRGAAALVEEITSLGPVKLRDVDAAQQEIISLARELEKEGLLSLKGGSEEKYVE